MIIENGAAAYQNWCGIPFSLFAFHNGCFSTKSNPDFYDRPDTCIPQFPQVLKFRNQIFLGAPFAAVARGADIFDNNVSFHSRSSFQVI